LRKCLMSATARFGVGLRIRQQYPVCHMSGRTRHRVGATQRQRV
jgi:hypothetical protein